MISFSREAGLNGKIDEGLMLMRVLYALKFCPCCGDPVVRASARAESGELLLTTEKHGAQVVRIWLDQGETVEQLIAQLTRAAEEKRK